MRLLTLNDNSVSGVSGSCAPAPLERRVQMHGNSANNKDAPRAANSIDPRSIALDRWNFRYRLSDDHRASQRSVAADLPSYDWRTGIDQHFNNSPELLIRASIAGVSAAATAYGIAELITRIT